MNKVLAKKRKLGRITKINIKALQQKMNEVLHLISKTDINNEIEYKELLTEWREINYILQDLWGFKLKKEKHKSWLLPKCICAYLDNKDANEHRHFNQDCLSCNYLNEIDKTYVVSNR